MVVKVPHEASRLEVEDFERAIFTGGEEPLVVLLELKSRNVAGVTFEVALLVDDLTGAGLRNLIDLDKVVRGDAQILAVRRHGKLVDLGGGCIDIDLLLREA